MYGIPVGTQVPAGGTESAQAPSETEPRCWLGQGYRRRGQGTEGGFREEVTEDLGPEEEQGWSGTGGDDTDPRLAEREEASGTGRQAAGSEPDGCCPWMSRNRMWTLLCGW